MSIVHGATSPIGRSAAAPGAAGRPRERVRINIELPPNVGEDLDELAGTANTTRTEIIRRAIALAKVMADARHKGQHLALVDDYDHVVAKIIGL